MNIGDINVLNNIVNTDLCDDLISYNMLRKNDNSKNILIEFLIQNKIR